MRDRELWTTLMLALSVTLSVAAPAAAQEGAREPSGASAASEAIAADPALNPALSVSMSIASRDIWRGMDVPTANQPVASTAIAASFPRIWLDAAVTGSAVLTDRGSDFHTEYVDEVAASLIASHRFFESGWLEAAAGVTARLYPYWMPYTYGSVVVEAIGWVGFPTLFALPRVVLAWDTTPAQSGIYGGVELAHAIPVRSADHDDKRWFLPDSLDIRVGAHWLANYLRQDMPTPIEAAQSAGVVGFLVSLLPVDLRTEFSAQFWPLPWLTVRPGFTLSIVSPLYSQINPETVEFVFSLVVSTILPSGGSGARRGSRAGDEIVSRRLW